MNNLNDVKNWDDHTISEQFIIRVKIFLIQKKVHECEKQAAKYKIDGTEYFKCLNGGIAHQVDQIKSLSFPIIKDVVLSPEANPFVKMSNGASFNTDLLVWDKLFRQPVQLVTNDQMSKPQETSGDDFSPCIIDNRLFISVDINTNEKRLLSEFKKCIGKVSIPHNTATNSQVTATSNIVRKNAFIQILDHRILKRKSLEKPEEQPSEDEINFVKEQIKYQFQSSDPNSSTLRRAAKEACEKLNQWLDKPAYITKLLDH